MESLSLSEMLEELYEKFKLKEADKTAVVDQFLNDGNSFVLFLSATDRRERARVVHARGKTLDAAWQEVTQELRKTLMLHKINPVWLKVDLVTSIETVSFPQM